MSTTLAKSAGDIRRLLAGAVLALCVAACGSGSDDTPAPVEADREDPPRVSGNEVEAIGAARDVGEERLAYAEVDEQLVYGHFAFPLDMVEPLPAVVVIHDWWGLNDDVKASANRLAAEGFMVLAVDLYDGDLATDAAGARQKMISVLEDPDAVEENLRQALRFVGTAGAPQKGTLGWGLGGGSSLNAAVSFANEITAAVVFYGQLPTEEEKLLAINAPVLVIHGARDRGIKVDTVTAFDAAMQDLDKRAQIEIYENAGHAFADPARQNYRAEEAADAWQKAVDFLSTELVATDGN